MVKTKLSKLTTKNEMEAKKLRLGNIVKGYNGFGELIFTVHSIDDDKIAIGGWSEITDGEGSGRGYMGLKGIFEIDMTDEWAAKFGYECMVEMACDFSSESKYRIEITSKDLETMKVNEVQNLFFALTGRELEMKTVCECEYPIIRYDLTEYCSICQKEVK